VYLSYRGSVNAWECDENNHLNVRFYAEKHWQTLSGGLVGLGLAEHIPSRELAHHVNMQHMRFLVESRLAATLSGYVGIVAVHENAIDVLTELRHGLSGNPSSTCIHRLTSPRAAVTDSLVTDSLPVHAQPRGLSDKDVPYATFPITNTESFGFQTIGMGAIFDSECDTNGHLQIHHYMGRVSDSMPHLWGLLESAGSNQDDREGGAVLEYRLRYHQPLSRGQHFRLNSGVVAVAPKVQRFAHLMFNEETQELCLSAEAIAVRMDLGARKAVTLNQARLAQLRLQLLKAV